MTAGEGLPVCAQSELSLWAPPGSTEGVAVYPPPSQGQRGLDGRRRVPGWGCLPRPRPPNLSSRHPREHTLPPPHAHGVLIGVPLLSLGVTGWHLAAGGRSRTGRALLVLLSVP